jgi:heme/copper-type cytochrome/quinol oxidase subunit 2
MDEKFWKLIWILITSVACVLIISVTSCMMHIDYRIARAIKAGANPVEARYAFSNTYTGADLAILRLSQTNDVKK